MNRMIEIVSIGFTLVIALAIIGLLAGLNGVHQEIQTVKEDVNFLGKYIITSIQTEQTANQFLAGCKIQQDNNTSIVLTCLKPSEGIQ